MRAAALYLGVADFRRQGNRALCGDGREQQPHDGTEEIARQRGVLGVAERHEDEVGRDAGYRGWGARDPQEHNREDEPSAPVYVLGMRQRFR